MVDDELINMIMPCTYLTPDMIRNLMNLSSVVNNKRVAGDMVECGTYKGGSCAAIGSRLLPNQHLWLYDSFEGLPVPSKIDGVEAKKWVGRALASENDVIDILTRVGISSDKYTIRKGWFEQTFRERTPNSVSLLHCDADWYDSVMITLETFYPLVTTGGCIILDDFGWWEGCREAFYDFCSKYKIKPLLERFGITQAYWFKGNTHNRG